MMKAEKTIVMGGSFHPPTRAHLLLMRTALDLAEAETGLFVPVSDAYLKRKLKNDDTRRVFFSFETRVTMLRAMCRNEPRASVSEADKNNPVSSFYALLCELQNAYPEAKLYYTAGTDKLPLLDQVFRKTDFADRFGLLLFSRDGAFPEERLASYPALYARREAILPAQAPSAASGVSSTEIRRRILAGEPVRDCVDPAVWELLRNVRAEDFPEEIAGFTEKYAFLDNRFPAPLTYRGESYLCAEAAFQATKTADPNRRAAFRAYTGEKAREKGAALYPSPEWESRKIGIMREILSAKFRQNPALAGQLLATGNAALLNLTNKDRDCWGINRYTYTGENMLGKLLTELRAELSEE